MSRLRQQKDPVNAQDNGEVAHPVPGDAQEPDAGDTSFEPDRLEAESSSKAGSVIDPFDPDTYRKAQNLTAASGVKDVLVELAVGSPKAHWWVRVHREHWFPYWVIDLKDEREQYLVMPHLIPLLRGMPTLKYKHFHLAVTMQGLPFLWAIRVPLDDTRPPDKWMVTPIAAVAQARKVWTQMSWNEETKKHDLRESDSAVEPVWPDLPLRELIKLGFGDKVVKDMSHPVVTRLQGRSR
jgi:hypothetical protein